MLLCISKPTDSLWVLLPVGKDLVIEAIGKDCYGIADPLNLLVCLTFFFNTEDFSALCN